MEKQLNIPDYWEQISLVDDFIYVPTGVENYEGKKPYYSTGSIKTQANTVEGEYSSIDRPSRANRIAKKGDVLQARMKDTNKALIIDQGLDGALFSTGFFQVRPYNNTYSSKLLYYYLFSNSFLNEKNDLCSGSTQSALNDLQAKKLYIPLPPLAEQHRIVDKIESLFSELDSSVKNLKTAKEQLKYYHQSVLKSAFEGKLTATWRETNADRLETAETLVQWIKTEREEAYEEKLTEWKKTVKMSEMDVTMGKKTSKPTKHKELQPLSSDEIAELLELPNGWKWIKLGEAFSISGGLTKNASRDKMIQQVPFLRVANVYSNELKLDDIHTIGISDNEIERVLLHENDILIVEGNGSGDQIGRMAIWNGSIKGMVHQNHLIKARPSLFVNPKYCLYFFQSMAGRELITRVATSTSGLFTLNLFKVENLLLPLVAIDEQNQIVNEIESRFSEADMMERTIDESLIKAEKMRQSILKKAFEGKFVTQNSNEESVKELLERIKEEKIKYQKELKNQKKNKVKIVKKVSIVETLQKAENNTMKSKELWQQSQYHDDIEGFYAALKKEIEEYQTIEEYKNDENDQSYVRLRNAD